jgi:hypothetical protein
MPKRRSHPAELALAIDGSVLLNVTSLLDEPTRSAIARATGNADNVFIGVALTGTDARRVRRKLDDASAEAAAVVLATKEASPTTKRARKRASR